MIIILSLNGINVMLNLLGRIWNGTRELYFLNFTIILKCKINSEQNGDKFNLKIFILQNIYESCRNKQTAFL